MALINGSEVDFDDVRVVICLNGFSIENQFQIAELGFWSRNIKGVLPFKSTKAWTKLNHIDKITANYLTKEYHGIELSKMKDQEALNQNDIYGAIRAIYHLCDDGNENRKLIGYMGNQVLLDVLGKMGIGNYLVKIQDIVPSVSFSMENIRKDEKYGRREFSICNLHNDLDSGLTPNCARAIANYLAAFCQRKSEID